MKDYKYVAIEAAGQRRRGVTRAESHHDVIERLRSENLTPILVEEALYRRAPAKPHWWGWRAITSADLAGLCWQMGAMLEGGVPILLALEVIADDTENVRMRRMIRQIKDRLSRGIPLAEAVAEFPKVFNKLACAIILAGETSGTLDLAMRRLAQYYDDRDKLIRKIRGAMAYPVFVAVFVIAITVIIMTFIVPRFEFMFRQFGNRLPAFTVGFFKVYHVIQANLAFILVGLVAAAVGLVLLCRTAPGHAAMSRFLLKVPMFGTLIGLGFLAMFCKVFSTLLSSGVPLLGVFDILADMTNNDVIKAAVLQTKRNVMGGAGIAISMAHAGFFPNLIVKMTQVGEESGSLPEILQKTGGHYERRVGSLIEAMTSLVQPLLIIVMGAIVAVIVIALYLPIFSLTDIRK